jgi:DNA polymerase II large subunit
MKSYTSKNITFEQEIEHFKKIKANSLDLETEICSKIYNDPIDKMLCLIPNDKLKDWLHANFHAYKREKLYKLICDNFLNGIYGEFNRAELIDNCIRTVLGIATEGVVSTPVEGLSTIYVGKNVDNSEFIGIKYAGPIRAAGGTAAGITVLVAMYLSKKLKLSFIPTETEIERYVLETKQYIRRHPQVINPNPLQITKLINFIPVCIDGVAAEKALVNAHRYLPRVSTPYLRGGAILVLVVLIIKAKKLSKLGEILELELQPLIDIYNLSDFKKTGSSSSFLDSIVAGRAVFAGEKRGGFRLRLGRARNTGLGCQGISPATMTILKFLNVGSQMMTSAPGKANSVVPVSDLEGPMVELMNGDFMRITNENVELYLYNVKRIYDLGEMLIAYGEFIENGYPIKQIDHSLDYWRNEYGSIPNLESNKLIEYCLKNNFIIIPSLSPKTHALTLSEWIHVRNYFKNTNVNDYLTVEGDISEFIKIAGFSYKKNDHCIKLEHPLLFEHFFLLLPIYDELELTKYESVWDILVNESKLKFGKKGSFYIGCRLASVEAAAVSKIGTGIHLVYSTKHINQNVQVLQKISGSLQKVHASAMICPQCNTISVQLYCIECKVRNRLYNEDKIEGDHNFQHDLLCAAKTIKVAPTTYDIKVTKELDRANYWEPFEKGLMRAKYDLSVFKDGVIKMSISNIALTHFKPIELNLTVNNVLNLGYTHDEKGEPITNVHQIIQLKIQDIILPSKFANYLLLITKFIDELLINYYKEESFYKYHKTEDLIGLNMATIAPHIMNGTCCRLIGFLPHNAYYSHPLLIAGRRRNADGDKDTVSVLSDVLLNYSTLLLKEGNGRYMNVYEILSTKIFVSSVDKEVTNMDIVDKYPSHWYESKNIFGLNETIKNVGTIKDGEENLVSYNYSTNTDFISMPSAYNAYKELNTLEEKIDSQIELALKISSVDSSHVLCKVIDGHLLKDLIGNTRKFLRQSMRCTKCNIVYEICPLSGNCKKCKNMVNFTVHPNSVIKYIPLLDKYSKKYKFLITPYIASAITVSIKEAEEIILPHKKSQVMQGLRRFLK